MQRYFAVTAPSVHQMVLTLEAKGFIARYSRSGTVGQTLDSARRPARSRLVPK